MWSGLVFEKQDAYAQEESALSYLRGGGAASYGSPPIALVLVDNVSSLGWEHINLTGDCLGAATPRSAPASLGHYDLCNPLRLRFFQFSEAPPYSIGTGEPSISCSMSACWCSPAIRELMRLEMRCNKEAFSLLHALKNMLRITSQL